MESYEVSNSQHKLVEVSEALAELSSQLADAPSFKRLLQDCLLKEVQRLVPEIYISRVFINYHGSGSTSATEPTGVLNDVFMECLLRGRAPVYNADEYGVYDWRDSSAEEDRHSVLDIATVSKLLTELLPTLPEKYAAALDQYWSSSQGADAKGQRLPARKNILRSLYVKLFWRELATMVAEGGLTRDDEKKIYDLTSPLVPSAFYSVSVQLQKGSFAALASTFVMRLDGQSLGALIPAVDSAVILYTPSRGVEKFATSAALHEELKARLSEPERRDQLMKGLSFDDAEQVSIHPEVRYSRIDSDVFGVCINAVLAKQGANITRQLRKMHGSPADNEQAVREISALLHLNEVRENAKDRAVVLIKLVSKNARPEWLKASYETNQEIYASLEQTHLESDIKLHSETKGVSSFKNYVHGVVQEFISSDDDDRIDPDTIFVNVRHTLRVGGKWIPHTERKNLTQLFMYGIHDKKARFEITVEGQQTNPKLSPQNIEYAVQRFDLRMTYAQNRNRVYAFPHVQEAMQETLGRKVALTLFAAILQKHISPKAQDTVQRYNFGDPSIETVGIALRGSFRPFKDIVAYRKRDEHPEQTAYILYAPGSTSGRDWYEFADLKSMQRQFGHWAFTNEGREYLRSQAHGSERGMLDGHFYLDEPRSMLQEWWWTSISVSRWATGEEGPLKGSVQNIIAWGASEEQVLTPDWFRRASMEDRQLFTRLSTELKIISGISAEKLNIPTFKKFARDLVMKHLNEYLKKTGGHPDIDPDQVSVKLKGHDYMTLTQLFVNWEVWRSDVSPVIKALARVHYGVSELIVQLKDLLREASFESTNGQSLGRLSVSVINSLIDLLPGDRYVNYLKSEYRDYNSPELLVRADAYTKLKQNEMLRGALVQKMKGALTQQRFDWLSGVIGDLDLDRDYSSYPDGPFGRGLSAFHLEGKRIEGAYVFSRTVNGQAEHLVYLPGSYSEKLFRPLEQLTRDIREGNVRNEILANVRLEDYDVVHHYVNKARLEDQPPPSLRYNHPIDSFRSEYLVALSRFIADVDHQTTSSSEALWRDALIVTELAVDVVSFAIPIVGLVASVLRITRSVVTGVIAAAKGNDSVANQHFAAAWRSAITLYVGKVAGIGSPVSAISLLSNLRDISELVTAVTGVPVGMDYLYDQIVYSSET